MEVFVERTNEKRSVSKSDAATVESLLAFLAVNPDEVLVMCNGALVTDDEALDDDDNIKLLSVVSGG